MAAPTLFFPDMVGCAHQIGAGSAPAIFLRPRREQKARLRQLLVDAGIMTVERIMRFRSQFRRQVLIEERIDLIGESMGFLAQIEIDRDLARLGQGRLVGRIKTTAGLFEQARGILPRRGARPWRANYRGGYRTRS